ncbi:GtrA family protein [Rhodobacterales bacterium HKCCE2091]|nr:GtrA family protein [Rhodobacterales bacterium HKCCE2091]
MTLRVLAFRYAAFAVLATAANLAVQRLVLWPGDGAPPWRFVLALVLGTGVGLVVKYVLDKRWIFDDRSTGLRAHSTRFSLYAAMGLVTTAIFWATETLFWLTWQTDLAREAGAVLGLAIGYVTKYRLDRRFVFRAGA